MFRFSMRELMLLVSLAGVAIAWCVELRGRENSQQALAVTRAHAERLRKSLEAAEGVNGMLEYALENPGKPQCWQVPYPDWKLAKQSIP